MYSICIISFYVCVCVPGDITLITAEMGFLESGFEVH